MLIRILLTVVALALATGAATGAAHGGAGGIDDEAKPAATRDVDTNPYTGDPAAIVAGKELWRDTGCYSCHGGLAEGGVGPNLTDDTWVYKPTDKMLFKTISKGRSGTNMVGWSADLEPDQIWQVIAYIRSLYLGSPKKIIW
jgi:cytochrome c oxidase cbb3-type subunit 3